MFCFAFLLNWGSVCQKSIRTLFCGIFRLATADSDCNLRQMLKMCTFEIMTHVSVIIARSSLMEAAC